MSWIAPPEPVTWTLPKPVAVGTNTYTTVTLRAPTPGDILKAKAIRGEDGMAVALRLISAVSQEEVPFEALALIPSWLVEQMSNYFEVFSGAPLPDPLRAYHAALAAAALGDTDPQAA